MTHPRNKEKLNLPFAYTRRVYITRTNPISNLSNTIYYINMNYLLTQELYAI